MTPEQQYVSEKKIFWEVEDGAELTIYPADQIVDEVLSRIEMEHAHISISRVEMTQAEFDRLVCYEEDEDESDPRYLERLAHVQEMERIAAEQTAAQNNPIQQKPLIEG